MNAIFLRAPLARNQEYEKKLYGFYGIFISTYY